MGPLIIERQNEDSSIRCLAAARQIYSDAKFLFALQIIFTTLIVVLLTLINRFHNIECFLATYCILVAITDSVFFDEYIKKQKEKAAVIQEMFDTHVLCVEWNDFIDKIDHEIIYRFSEKYKKKEPTFNSLNNWYSPEIKDIKGEEAKIICQFSNCRYDLSLRRIISLIVYLLAFLSSTLIILFSIAENITFKDVFMHILLPLLPIIVFSIQRIKENNQSIKNLNKMKKVAFSYWEKIIRGDDVDLSKVPRKIQNRIFKNRKNSPLIFDWFYTLHKSSLEDEMNYSVDQLILKYNNSK